MNAAFDELVRTNTARLYRLALRLTGSAAEAEDIVQETYLRAYVALAEGRFKGEAAVATWLYRVALNTSLDLLRSRKRQSAFQRALRMAVIATERLEAHALVHEAAHWIASLPPDQAGALVLTQIEGLSNAEAAAALGCSEGAIEQRLIRARANLNRRRDS